MIVRAALDHWQLRLACLVAAAAVWAWVVQSDRTQIAVAAPLEYVGVRDDLVVVGSPRDTVDVYVEAPRWAAGRVSSDTVRVRVDLATTRAGESLTQLTPADVQLPPGVTVTRIAPARLRVTLAPAAQETVRVVAQIRGAPAPGHTVERVRVEPSAVQVRGPRSTIEGQVRVETAPVDVTGSTTTVTQTVGLVLPAFVYATRERSVQVRVDIRPEGRMRESRK